MLEPEYKVGIYVRIAQLHLEDEEAVQAEAYINRGKIRLLSPLLPLVLLTYS